MITLPDIPALYVGRISKEYRWVVRKEKDATYQVAVSGAKGAIRILLYVLLICVLIFVGKTAYSFGYLIFYQEPEAHTQADGQDVTVIVHEDDSVYDVGGNSAGKRID